MKIFNKTEENVETLEKFEKFFKKNVEQSKL